MVKQLLSPLAIAAGHIHQTIRSSSNVLPNYQSIFIFKFLKNNHRRYKSSNVTGVAFSPLPDAELKIQLYYKKQQIKKRKEKLKEIAQSIWNNKPNVNYVCITLDECRAMYEEHTGHQPTSWEAKQIYRSVNLILFIAIVFHYKLRRKRQYEIDLIVS
jgi:hypothetical protein